MIKLNVSALPSTKARPATATDRMQLAETCERDRNRSYSGSAQNWAETDL
jgi:hypothetical protein